MKEVGQLSNMLSELSKTCNKCISNTVFTDLEDKIWDSIVLLFYHQNIARNVNEKCK